MIKIIAFYHITNFFQFCCTFNEIWNISDPVAGQKKLIVDESIIPDKAMFDYSQTTSMPSSLTIDGALDGIAHTLEVFMV